MLRPFAPWKVGATRPSATTPSSTTLRRQPPPPYLARVGPPRPPSRGPPRQPHRPPAAGREQYPLVARPAALRRLQAAGLFSLPSRLRGRHHPLQPAGPLRGRHPVELAQPRGLRRRFVLLRARCGPRDV